MNETLQETLARQVRERFWQYYDSKKQDDLTWLLDGMIDLLDELVSPRADKP